MHGVIPRPAAFSRSAAMIALIFLGLSPSCESQGTLSGKRIRAVEKGLLRSVYLQGLQPEKLLLSERMAFYKVPGVGIASIDRNALEWVKAYGEQDAMTHDPLTTSLVFQAGAFGQIVAAATVLRLAEQGVFDLDDKAGSRLRSWNFPSGFAPQGDPVTLRKLLTHSAGLSDQVFPGYGPEDPLPTLDQVLDGVKPARNGPVWVGPRQSAPLKAWWSESGYAVLEKVLQDATGKDFAVLAAEAVLGPAGMAHSTFAMIPPETLPAASGHLREGGIVPGRWARYPERAAKGFWTTPADFASFLTELLNEASGRSGTILTPAGARILLSAQVENFGFGFFVEGRGDDINYHVWGKTQGYTCAMVVYPARGQGAVVMTNSANGDLLGEEILAAFAAAYAWPHYHPVEKPVLRLSPETYGEFAGLFEVKAGYALEVRPEDYYLVITPSGQAPTKFFAEGQTLFYSTDPYIRIQFFRDPEGRIDSLVLWQKDFRLEARKR